MTKASAAKKNLEQTVERHRIKNRQRREVFLKMCVAIENLEKQVVEMEDLKTRVQQLQNDKVELQENNSELAEYVKYQELVIKDLRERLDTPPSCIWYMQNKLRNAYIQIKSLEAQLEEQKDSGVLSNEGQRLLCSD